MLDLITRKNAGSILTVLTAGLVLVLIGALGSSSGEVLSQWAAGLGVAAPLALGFILLVTEVFAPISSAPAQLVTVRLYGPEWALTLLYAVSMASATVNFWLARRYGRPLAVKMAGKEALARLDAFSRMNERTFLVVGRLFGNPLFDALSYAYGLGTVRYGAYMLATAALCLPSIGLQYLLLRSVDVTTSSGLALFFGGLAGMTAVGIAILLLVTKKASHGRS